MKNDLISRQAAMEEISKQQTYKMFEGEDTLYLDANDVGSVLASLPSAQPEIIMCKDCVKHNKGHGYYLGGTVIGIKDCCPLVEIRGMAQGHEFDYQYCAYAERRTDEAD